MYIQHPSCETPSDRKIFWRYMSLSKLVYLLDRKLLYFTRSDRLGDKFEGSFPRGTRELLIRQFKLNKNINSEKILSYLSSFKKYFYINSWHQNRYESDAMWKIYSSNDKCIALKSTIGKFKQSIIEAGENIYIGKIKYIDYIKETVHPRNLINPFLYKRKIYFHENEVRAIYANFNSMNDKFPRIENNDELPLGVSIKCNPTVLISKIIISPSVEGWEFNVIQSICEKYGIASFRVKRSSLLEEPYA